MQKMGESKLSTPINENENISCDNEKNSLENYNTAKTNKVELNMTAFSVQAKRGKFDNESCSVQDYDHSKRNLVTHNAKEVIDADIILMKEKIEESRKKYPLPVEFANSIDGCYGNRMLRFDDIGPISDVFAFMNLIPMGLHRFINYWGVYLHPSGSQRFAFVKFRRHEIALSFLKKFNGLKVPGTEFKYQISWAPLTYVFSDQHVDESDPEDDPEDDLKMYPEDDPEDGPNDVVMKTVKDESVLGGSFPWTTDVIEILGLAQKWFYGVLHDEAHSKNNDDEPWVWHSKEIRRFNPILWGQPSDNWNTIYIENVDPVIEEEELARVFRKHGKCEVDVPTGRGCGIVKFEERHAHPFFLILF